MSAITCARTKHGFFDEADAVAVVTVGCVHEHVVTGVGACQECLDGLRDGTMECAACGDAGHRGCRMLVSVVRELESVPA